MDNIIINTMCIISVLFMLFISFGYLWYEIIQPFIDGRKGTDGYICMNCMGMILSEQEKENHVCHKLSDGENGD